MEVGFRDLGLVGFLLMYGLGFSAFSNDIPTLAPG